MSIDLYHKSEKIAIIVSIYISAIIMVALLIAMLFIKKLMTEILVMCEIQNGKILAYLTIDLGLFNTSFLILIM